MQLEVVIQPGGSAFTAAELAERLPELHIEVAPSIERAPVRFVGRIVVEDEADAESRWRVLSHLQALRAFSQRFPGIAIMIAEPEGGVLRLEAGTFGTDDADLVAMLDGLTVERWRLLVSFRIAADGHRYLLDLIAAAVPASLTPIVEASEATIALGYEIDGDAARTADVLAALRVAWRQEASEVECLVEIEGSHPVLAVVKTLADWIELERSLRRGAAKLQAGAAAARPSAAPLALARRPSTAEVLHGAALTWIDDSDQILCLTHDTLYALPERIEAGATSSAAIVTRGDGSVLFVDRERRFELPSPSDDAERRLHGVDGARALFSDTTGSGDAATTRLVVVTCAGIDEGPPLRCVRAISQWAGHAYAIAATDDGPRLCEIELGGGWGHSYSKPWGEAEPTDLAVISRARVAITTQHGQRSILHLIERGSLWIGRAIALPCTAPQIVGHSDRMVWIAGLAPGSPRRCDLFRVSVRTGKVVVETAELSGLDRLEIACNATATRAIGVTSHAVWSFDEDDVPRELTLLGTDEVTGVAFGRVNGPEISAVLLRGATASRLLIERTSVPLDTPGHSPLFVLPSEHGIHTAT